MMKYLNILDRKNPLNLGGLKIITDRAATYANRVLTVINLLLLVNLNVNQGADLWQYLPLVVVGTLGFIILMVIDMVIIYPQEIEYRDERSPTLTRIRHSIKAGEQVKE